MRPRLVPTVVLAMALLAVLPAPPSRAILNGQVDASSGSYVVEVSSSRGSCSGTLISPHWVLTAAHCLTDTDLPVVSAVDLRTGFALWTLPVENLNVHPEYNSDRFIHHDLALLRLRFSAPGPYATLATAAELEAARANSATAVTSGFGTTSISAQAASPVPLEAHLRIITSPDCPDGATICTESQTGANVCYGDSGGPLFLEVGSVRKLIGLASYSYSENCDGVVIHMSVLWYEPWIRATVLDLPATPAATPAPTSTCPAHWIQRTNLPRILRLEIGSIHAGHEFTVQMRRHGVYETLGTAGVGPAGMLVLRPQPPVRQRFTSNPLRVLSGAGVFCTAEFR